MLQNQCDCMLIMVPCMPRELKTMRLRMQRCTLLKQVRSDTPSGYQCARYSSKPKRQHGEAVKWLGRYLLATRDKGYYMHIDEDKGITVWADSDFSGNWDPEHSMHDPNTARLRSGYFITYLGAPLMWKSSLQTKIALSTCEAEYICLSQALCKVIPIMDLVQELKDKGVPVGGTKPTVKCKMFKDNSAALTLANAPAMCPTSAATKVIY
jgi:hypothetical protein